MVVTGCQENKSCSEVLNFLDRLDDRIRCTHEETVAVVNCFELASRIANGEQSRRSAAR